MIERVKWLLTKPDDAEGWVRRVRAGTRVLFWATLTVMTTRIVVSTLLIPLLVGYLAPLSPGIIPECLMLIPALLRTPVIIAIFAMTLPSPGRPRIATSGILRRMLRPIIIAALGFELAYIVLAFLGSYGIAYTIAAWLESILGAATFLGVFLFVGTLAERFALSRLARSARVVAWCCLGVWVFRYFLTIYQWLAYSASTSLSSPAVLMGLSVVARACSLAVMIWGWVVLWKSGSRLPEAARGRCVCCGYSLRELTGNVCPECGATFQPEQRHTAIATPVVATSADNHLSPPAHDSGPPSPDHT